MFAGTRGVMEATIEITLSYLVDKGVFEMILCKSAGTRSLPTGSVMSFTSFVPPIQHPICFQNSTHTVSGILSAFPMGSQKQSDVGKTVCSVNAFYQILT